MSVYTEQDSPDTSSALYNWAGHMICSPLPEQDVQALFSVVKQREISKFGQTRQSEGWREAQNCSLNTAQWVSGSVSGPATHICSQASD